MKDISIIGIICIGFGLSAFKYATTNHEAAVIVEREPDFFYDLGSEYRTTITKQQLDKAISILDIIPEQANWRSSPIERIELSVLNHYFLDLSATSTHLTLNGEQIRLLRSAYYADNLRIIANCVGTHQQVYNLSYFITVVPEKEAYYSLGQDAFLNYLKENSKTAISGIEVEKLRPGKISFTINTAGELSNVELLTSSGYFAIDDRMLTLLKKAPGKWSSATNEAGENVEQKLFFSFGAMGC